MTSSFATRSSSRTASTQPRLRRRWSGRGRRAGARAGRERGRRCSVDRDQPRVRDPRSQPHGRDGQEGSLRLGRARGGHSRRACGCRIDGSTHRDRGPVRFPSGRSVERPPTSRQSPTRSRRPVGARLVHVKPYPTSQLHPYRNRRRHYAARAWRHVFGHRPRGDRLTQPGAAHGGRATRAEDPSPVGYAAASADRSHSPRRCGAEVDWVCFSTI